MSDAEPIIDAWIQHPTPAFLRDDLFASLRRWMGIDTVPDSIPIELTIGALDAAGVQRGLCSVRLYHQRDNGERNSLGDTASPTGMRTGSSPDCRQGWGAGRGTGFVAPWLDS